MAPGASGVRTKSAVGPVEAASNSRNDSATTQRKYTVEPRLTVTLLVRGVQVLRNAMGGGGVSFPGKKRYEGVRFNVIIIIEGAWIHFRSSCINPVFTDKYVTV